MSTTVLHRVQSLVAALSEHEIAKITRFLATSKNAWEEKSKILELFENLNADIDIDARSKRQMLEILEARILEILALPASGIKFNDNISREELELVAQKELLKIKIFTSQGLKPADDFSNNALIQQLIAREMYDLVIQFLEQKLVNLNHPGVYELAKPIKEQIDSIRFILKWEQRAFHLFNELQIKKRLGLLENIDMLIQSGINDLQSPDISEVSATIRFVLEYYMKENCLIFQKYDQAQTHMNRILAIWDRGACKTLVKDRKELLYERILIFFKAGQIEEASQRLYKLLEDNFLGDFTYISAHRLLTQILVRKKEPENILAVIHNFSKVNLRKSSYLDEYLQDLLNYEVFALFINKNYSHCIQVLATSTYFKKMEVLFHLQLRLIYVLCLMELGRLDECENYILATKKYIQRSVDVESDELKNSILFFQLLNKLKNRGFDINRLEKNDLKDRTFRNITLSDISISGKAIEAAIFLWLREKLNRAPLKFLA